MRMALRLATEAMEKEAEMLERGSQKIMSKAGFIGAIMAILRSTVFKRT